MRRPEIQHHVLMKKRTGKLPSERCFPFRFDRCLTANVNRAHLGALRHHGAAGEIPRSPDRPGVRQLVRVQRDPTAVERRIPVEHLAWMLRWPDRQRRSRGSRPILETGLELGRRRTAMSGLSGGVGKGWQVRAWQCTMGWGGEWPPFAGSGRFTGRPSHRV